jgi:sulfur relay (sulfurtransferase) DsrF/TusC family protein
MQLAADEFEAALLREGVVQVQKQQQPEQQQQQEQ